MVIVGRTGTGMSENFNVGSRRPLFASVVSGYDLGAPTQHFDTAGGEVAR
jgi:hypothetical protein